MDQSTLISVIVPVYKVEKMLPRCVDALLSQTYQNTEIILVDDGSPDGSGALCDAYAEKDPRVRAIHKENGGASTARNMGIDLARGEYIVFADSDDWAEPEYLEAMLTLAKKYDVKLVCVGRYDVDGETGKRTRGLCPVQEEKISGKELVKRVFLWDNVDSAPWDKIFHRSLLREIRFPVGTITEDVPTIYRLALEAGEAVLCPRPLYNYFHHGGSVTMAKAITAKTFHYVYHTGNILKDILENHPDLEVPARYLRVRSLLYTMETLQRAGEEDRKKYQADYEAYHRELKENVSFIRKSGLFARGDRLMAWMLLGKVYRPIRKTFRFLTGRDRGK